MGFIGEVSVSTRIMGEQILLNRPWVLQYWFQRLFRKVFFQLNQPFVSTSQFLI